MFTAALTSAQDQYGHLPHTGTSLSTFAAAALVAIFVGAFVLLFLTRKS